VKLYRIRKYGLKPDPVYESMDEVVNTLYPNYTTNVAHRLGWHRMKTEVLDTEAAMRPLKRRRCACTKPLRLSQRTYCSLQCKENAEGTSKPGICPCGKPLFRRKKECANRWARRRYCSQECSWDGKRGVPL